MVGTQTVGLDLRDHLVSQLTLDGQMAAIACCNQPIEGRSTQQSQRVAQRIGTGVHDLFPNGSRSIPFNQGNGPRSDVKACDPN